MTTGSYSQPAQVEHDIVTVYNLFESLTMLSPDQIKLKQMVIINVYHYVEEPLLLYLGDLGVFCPPMLSFIVCTCKHVPHGLELE